MRPRALLWLTLPALIGAAIAVRAAIHTSREAPTDKPPTSSTEAPDSQTGARSTTDPTKDAPLTGPLSTGTLQTDTLQTGALQTTTSGTGTLTDSAPHIVKASPSGVRVPLDAKVEIRFDRAPDPAKIKLTLEPPVEGTTSWPDPQTLTFTPTRLADGKPYHATVEQPGSAPFAFDFRSLYPPPDRVEPGRGQPITLTFDDGSDRPAQVTELLDLLQKEAIGVVFFPTGKWAERFPKLLQRMIEDGHRVCNHTYSHQSLRAPQLTEGEIKTEILRGATDGKCRLFRPPLKAFDPRVERIITELGYTMYLWDVDSRDWEGAATEDIVNLVLTKVHPGAVLLFHMHQQTTLEALPKLLPKLRKAGYTFNTAEDGAPAK